MHCCCVALVFAPTVGNIFHECFKKQSNKQQQFLECTFVLNLAWKVEQFILICEPPPHKRHVLREKKNARAKFILKLIHLSNGL